MIMSGRKTNLMIALEDKPGQLTRVSEIISGMGANVVSVQYDLCRPQHDRDQLLPQARP